MRVPDKEQNIPRLAPACLGLTGGYDFIFYSLTRRMSLLSPNLLRQNTGRTPADKDSPIGGQPFPPYHPLPFPSPVIWCILAFKSDIGWHQFY